MHLFNFYLNIFECVDQGGIYYDLRTERYWNRHPIKTRFYSYVIMYFNKKMYILRILPTAYRESQKTWDFPISLLHYRPRLKRSIKFNKHHTNLSHICYNLKPFSYSKMSLPKSLSRLPSFIFFETLYCTSISVWISKYLIVFGKI